MKRDDLNPMARAVSDALDEVLFRHHGIATSWSNPESFLEWLGERGYSVVPITAPSTTDPATQEAAHG